MLKFIAGAWVALGIGVAFLMPAANWLQTTPIAFFHVPMAIGMLLCFVIAAIYGVLWLVKRNPKHDALSLAFAEIGFVACAIALATGMIFSKTNWGAFWSFDPQQVGVLGTILTYGALFALRGATDDDRKKRDLWAVYAVLGAMVAIFGGYIFRQILPPGSSLHPNKTLTSSSPQFKFALWFNVFGDALLLICIAQTRARLEMVSARLRELSWS